MNEVKEFIDAYVGKLSLIYDFKNECSLTLYDYTGAYSKNGCFIEYESGVYKIGGCEKGNCRITFQSNDFFECLYHPIKGAIHTIAFKTELENRIDNIDSRIMGFGIMLNLMSKMGRPDWDAKLKSELYSIIERDKMPMNIIKNIADNSLDSRVLDDLETSKKSLFRKIVNFFSIWKIKTKICN